MEVVYHLLQRWSMTNGENDYCSFLHINQTCINKYRFLWLFLFIINISLLNLPWYSQFHPDTLMLFIPLVIATYGSARSWPHT